MFFSDMLKDTMYIIITTENVENVASSVSPAINLLVANSASVQAEGKHFQHFL
jgi:uncharacterized protein YaiL (DUF2058 family)